ncbi:hypothetical protein VTK26DRAFT_136 [Humicola hyalothermophila]
MKAYAAALVGAVLARRALGHQVHGILLVNGTESPSWKYVRDVATAYDVFPGEYPEGNDFPKTPPQTDIHSVNITCGRRAWEFAAQTETADVVAGSEVGFRVSFDGNATPYGDFWHPGPAQIYLARAPEDAGGGDPLASFRGDEGDWFKIAYAGPVADDRWALWPGESDFNFTIPRTTPPGKYLMRIEQFMPTYLPNYSQWYVNCAHVNIIGPGGGTPTEFAKFPGTYQEDHPGIHVPSSQVVNSDGEKNLLEYQAPGPAVWTG